MFDKKFEENISFRIEKEFEEKIGKPREKSEVMRKLLDISLQLPRRRMSLVDALLMAPSESVARGKERLKQMFGDTEFWEVISTAHQINDPLEDLARKNYKELEIKSETTTGMRLPSSLKKSIEKTMESINKRRIKMGNKKIERSKLLRGLMKFSLPIIESDMTVLNALAKSFPLKVEQNREFLYLLFGDTKLKYLIIQSLEKD